MSRRTTTMRTLFRYFAILSGCCCLYGVSPGQTFTPDSIAKRFDVYRRHALQEKIYVHLDRSFYLTGEVAWFKVYVTDGGFHKPLDVSKVAYAEILDADNHAVLQAKISLTGGSGSGSFFLPAVLSSGNYQLRVYTQWMRNFSPEFYFHQSITLVNPFTGGSPEVSPTPAALYAAQFYPEGGHLVAGIKSKVAFHIQDRAGRGADLRGALLDDGGDTVVVFRPHRFGIGYFYFTPQPGRGYRAVLIGDGSKAIPCVFPAVQPSGYALYVTDRGDSLTLRVAQRGDADAASVYLFVHARQMIVQAGARFLKHDSTVFTIRKADLPDGISHFTLFTARLQPVCERLYFRYPAQGASLSVASDQTAYGIRRKVTVTLQATAGGKPIPLPDVSLSVSRLDSLTVHPQTDIFSFLWLSSDLQGTPESPEYYFQERTSAIAEAMDNLMLTHGWRRFRWEDILSGAVKTPYVAEYRGHIIRGHVENAEGVSNAGILTYLSWPGKIVRLHSSRSDEHGDVQYEVKDFTGLRRVVVQTNLRRDSVHRVVISDPFSKQFTAGKLPAFSLLPAAREPVLRARSIGMQVNSIYQEGMLQSFRKPGTDSLSFYGKADETYFLDKYTRFQVMEEVMREYVPGVLVRKRRDGFHFLVLDDVQHSAFQEDPMILLDGVPVFDTDRIMAFDPLKVRKLEVLTRKYYLGSAVFPGIVSYSTYGGDLGGFELDHRCVALDYEGLQQQREFYAPVYETAKQRGSRLPDQRYLLHWSPSVAPQADGSAQVTFYTSDVPGWYGVSVEGITPNGDAVSARHTFLVRRFDD